MATIEDLQYKIILIKNLNIIYKKINILYKNQWANKTNKILNKNMISIYCYKKIKLIIYFQNRIVFYKWYHFKAVKMNLKIFNKLMTFHRLKVYRIAI